MRPDGGPRRVPLGELPAAGARGGARSLASEASLPRGRLPQPVGFSSESRSLPRPCFTQGNRELAQHMMRARVVAQVNF